MSTKHFIKDQDQSKEEILSVIELAKNIKQSPADYSQALAGKSVVMLFEKPSLRTHISFDIGIQKLGGHALYIGQQNGQLGQRERVKDVALNLACWSDAIVARVFEQSVLDELAQHAGIPVINALSDLYHPCQAMADYLTIAENFDDLSKVTLAYVGDGNNVAQSLLLVAAILGIEFKIVHPEGYGINGEILDLAQSIAASSGAKITITTDINALKNTDVIYTDTWISMGDDVKFDDIKSQFMSYQVNESMMKLAGAKYFMHCQPAHLGQEISESLFDSEYSLASQQAENRMWAQNAILVNLFSEK